MAKDRARPAAILASAQLAVDEIDPSSIAHEDLRIIEREARRCKTIIDNLLKFARQDRAEMKPTNVNGAVADAIAIVRHQIELNGVRVEIDLDPELPEVPGNAGWYKVDMKVRPHFKYMGAFFTLGLVGKLDKE